MFCTDPQQHTNESDLWNTDRQNTLVGAQDVLTDPKGNSAEHQAQ